MKNYKQIKTKKYLVDMTNQMIQDEIKVVFKGGLDEYFDKDAINKLLVLQEKSYTRTHTKNDDLLEKLKNNNDGFDKLKKSIETLETLIKLRKYISMDELLIMQKEVFKKINDNKLYPFIWMQLSERILFDSEVFEVDILEYFNKIISDYDEIVGNSDYLEISNLFGSIHMVFWESDEMVNMLEKASRKFPYKQLLSTHLARVYEYREEYIKSNTVIKGN